MEDNRVEKAIAVDQLPKNPNEMPPPYWRSCGATFHIIEALESIIHLLQKLVLVHEETDHKLATHYEKFPDEEEQEEELEEFSDICSELWDLEHKIKMKTEVAILMAAIEVEDSINQFCVYNLHKDIAETIEKLSPAEKLIVAAASVGKGDAKASMGYQEIRKLFSWRNAFTHGHCTDRPTKSLRHNHLISPTTYPGVPNMLSVMKELLRSYLKVREYLRSISLNPYTSALSSEDSQVKKSLLEINNYSFEGGECAYSISILNME